MYGAKQKKNRKTSLGGKGDIRVRNITGHAQLVNHMHEGTSLFISGCLQIYCDSLARSSTSIQPCVAKMSWFDSSFSFAKTALSQAQKSIDKVLDIKDGEKSSQAAALDPGKWAF